jgi:peroxiredoxin family protein
MNEENSNKRKEGLGIIFHSGSYDRICNGFHIAMTSLAMGRKVKIFFTFWSLRYLKKGKTPQYELDCEAERYKNLLEKHIEKGHLQDVSKLITLTKSIGGKLYVCTNSIELFEMTQDELIDEVDRSMGLVTFLNKVEDYQILFI